MRSLWTPVLIPVVILSAYLGWSWYQVKYVMDELIKNASPYASITYESIPLAFKGEYTVKGIEVDLFDSGAVTRINLAKLKSDDWQLMFLEGTPFQSDDFPESMSLALTGVEFDTDLQTKGQPLAAMLLEQPVADGCLKTNGQPVVLKDLALGTVNSDMTFEYRFNPENQIVNAFFNANTARIWSMGIGVDFDIGHSKLNKKLLLQTPPRILSVSIDALDQGYNQKLIDLCTDAGNITKEVFVQRNLEGIQAQLAPLGMVIPESLLTYYPELYIPGASFEAALDFTRPMPIDGWSAFIADADLLSLIRLRISVNQKTFDVTESLQAMNQQRQLELPEPSLFSEVSEADSLVENDSLSVEPLAQFKPPVAALEPTNSNEPQQAKEVTEKQPSKKKLEFVTVLVSQINQSAVGKKVRVNTFNGHLVEGEIIKVLNNRMHIRQEISNGTAEIPLMFKNIDKLQVKQ